jgi:hypothetical protein
MSNQLEKKIIRKVGGKIYRTNGRDRKVRNPFDI